MTSTESPLNLPKFFDNKVSTRTYIIGTNITFNIDKLFNILPITEYIVTDKKRGRRKKVIQPDLNVGIKCGSIISIKYKNKKDENVLRGAQLKKKATKNFRNSLTIVMICEKKKINFKISSNGKIQMTGCKRKEQVIKSLNYFWEYVQSSKEDNLYNIKHGKNLELILVPAMRNIDFSLGFLIDRSALSRTICEMPEEEYRSMLEPSFGYTGVNIKFLLEDDIIFLDIDKIIFNKDGGYDIEKISYSDYLDTLPEKDRQKKLEKDRYNTFLVFHSGKVIMSGITEELMEATYYKFLDIIKDNYEKIREKLDT